MQIRIQIQIHSFLGWIQIPEKIPENSEPIKYQFSVIVFGQISVIGYRLILTDMPSLKNRNVIFPCTW